MTTYILRRLFQAVVVLMLLSFLVYGLMGLMPGDPLDIACAANPHCTPENLEQMKKVLGLDRPVHERYLDWLGHFITGDLGYSRTYKKPVTEILLPRLGNTMILGLCALIVSFLIAIPTGVFASLKANSKFDYSVNFLAFLGISAPVFWLGLMLIIVFSVWLAWFPASGVETIGVSGWGWLHIVWDRIQYLVLPVAALSALTIASWVRYMRSSMLETMRLDFIRTARSKGLPEKDVVLKHGVRVAILPVLTVVALSVPLMFSGALITETVFAYQGIGKLLYDSIMGNDFNVAMCSFVIDCLAVLIMNLFADVAHAYLDPRIQLK